MKEIKKLLYLLQLEEYQTDRFYTWLREHDLKELKERKNRLKWTPRIIITLLISFPFSLFLEKSKAIGIINNFLKSGSSLIESILVFLAKIKLDSYIKLTKIVITGSYGKTTFKEMLAWTLGKQFPVLKTPENINSRIGIARLILQRFKKKHQVLIIEAAAYSRGEIKLICKLVKPDYGIITSIGWMHLERFKSLENIRSTKMELIPFIKDKKRLFLPSKMHQMIDFEKVCLEIGRQLGMKQEVIRARLKQFKPPKHRLSLKRIGRNISILDDTYNSNPLGFKRALKELAKFKNQQKIVVTPGMIELGDKQFSLNKQLAKEAKKVADILVIVGKTNQEALKKGFGGKNCLLVNKDEDLDKKLTAFLKPPTAILLENELPDHYF